MYMFLPNVFMNVKSWHCMCTYVGSSPCRRIHLLGIVHVAIEVGQDQRILCRDRAIRCRDTVFWSCVVTWYFYVATEVGQDQGILCRDKAIRCRDGVLWSCVAIGYFYVMTDFIQ